MFPHIKPILAGGRLSERPLAGMGAAVCLALTIAICSSIHLGASDLPIIVAPLGASAVLVFAVPASPLAQPWPVIGGNVISSLVGVIAFALIPNGWVAAGVAVGGAIVCMSVCRCLHPPGGAAALTAVIGGSAIHHAGLSFALFPVGLNSITLVLLGIAFNRIIGRSYPHRAPPIPSAEGMAGLISADIDAALMEMGEAFDISREDLDNLLMRAERHAVARRKWDT